MTRNINIFGQIDRVYFVQDIKWDLFGLVGNKVLMGQQLLFSSHPNGIYL